VPQIIANTKKVGFIEWRKRETQREDKRKIEERKSSLPSNFRGFGRE
jgi:hypothetical protein